MPMASSGRAAPVLQDSSAMQSTGKEYQGWTLWTGKGRGPMDSVLRLPPKGQSSIPKRMEDGSQVAKQLTNVIFKM